MAARQVAHFIAVISLPALDAGHKAESALSDRVPYP